MRTSQKLLIAASLSLVALSSSALADDDDASRYERHKIRDVLRYHGCRTHDLDIERTRYGTFKIDDAKCRGREYDIYLDHDFYVLRFKRD